VTIAEKEHMIRQMAGPFPAELEVMEIARRTHDDRLASAADTDEERQAIEAEYERTLDNLLAALQPKQPGR
jgi:hypothetical protein